MNANGTGQVRLTSNPGHDYHPSFSPDGKHIVFHSDRDWPTACLRLYACPSLEVYVMNADGTGVRRLTSNNSVDMHPVFGPSNKIVFVSDRDGSPGVYVMEPDGSAVTRVVLGPRTVTQPAFNSDGSRIAVQWFREDENYEIYTLNVDGSDVKRLTRNPANDGNPNWR